MTSTKNTSKEILEWRGYKFNLKRKIATGLTLLIFDTLLIFTTFIISVLIRNRLFPLFIADLPAPIPLSNYLEYSWILIFWVGSFYLRGLYTQRMTFWNETKRLWTAISLAMLITLTIVTLGKFSQWFSRASLIIAWVLLLALAPLVRISVKWLLFHLYIWRKRLLIIGAGKTGKSVFEALNGNTLLGYEVVGFADNEYKEQDKVIENPNQVPVLGSLSSLGKLKQKGVFEDAIIAKPSLSDDRLEQLIQRLRSLGAGVRLVPGRSSIPLFNADIECFFESQLFALGIHDQLTKPWNRFAKRAFDLLVGGVLCLGAVPIMVMLAILIKLDSRGPVFYTHQRIGKDNRNFTCYKFRSMYVNADEKLDEYLENNSQAKKEWERYKKLKSDDPRVTRIGKFIRKFSLDEMPQIFNVLKGEMSLVGPRPYLPRERDEIKEYIDVILRVRPGMTGFWTVSGKNEVEFEERHQLEAWYVRNWSLWLDIVILIKTVKTVLTREGAY